MIEIIFKCTADRTYLAIVLTTPITTILPIATIRVAYTETVATHIQAETMISWAHIVPNTDMKGHPKMSHPS